MRETHTSQMKYLQRWFDKFDSHFFEDFFSDKDIKISIKKFNGKYSYYEGWACSECGEIVINKECFIRLTPYGIRDTLLHEMIHLFVAYTFPGRTHVWGDEHRVFKKFEKDFQSLRRREFERRVR